MSGINKTNCIIACKAVLQKYKDRTNTGVVSDCALCQYAMNTTFITVDCDFCPSGIFGYLGCAHRPFDKRISLTNNDVIPCKLRVLYWTKAIAILNHIPAKEFKSCTPYNTAFKELHTLANSLNIDMVK